jgi:hypothetical protein
MNTETLAGTQVCPYSAAYNQYDLVTLDGEIDNIYRFQKPFGLKVTSQNKLGFIGLIKVNVNFG